MIVLEALSLVATWVLLLWAEGVAWMQASFHSHVVAFKQWSGVCCIKSYVSKRKKRGYEFGGWYVYLGNYTMKIQVNVPTLKFVPTYLTFTKRNFLYNAPQ